MIVVRLVKIPRRTMLAAGLAAGVPLSIPSAAPAKTPGEQALPAQPPPATPRAALDRLLAGNRRFAAGRMLHPRQGPADVRRLAGAQRPYAIVLGCADSRVPAELVFDQGLGDLYDNRVAGHVVDLVVLGSIEHAVTIFDPRLVLVLGHERCVAVTATVEALRTGETPPGHVRAVIDALRPAVAPVLSRPGDPVENAVRACVRYACAQITHNSAVIRSRIAAGDLTVTGARYDLDTARVTLVS